MESGITSSQLLGRLTWSEEYLWGLLPSLPTAWYGVVNTRRASLSTCSLQNCGVIEARFAVETGGGL